MRWNCPHCGTALALGDEKISTGWSFSKCYKCAGHALIRKVGVQLIKVDKAPPGETLLLPEASESAATTLAARTVQRASSATAAPMARTASFQRPQASTAASAASDMASVQKIFGQMPEALPELPPSTGSWIHKVLPAAIGLTGIAAIGSGVYLYFQGQTLIERARHNIVQTRAAPNRARTPTAANVTAPTQRLPNAEISDPQVQ